MKADKLHPSPVITHLEAMLWAVYVLHRYTTHPTAIHIIEEEPKVIIVLSNS